MKLPCAIASMSRSAYPRARSRCGMRARSAMVSISDAVCSRPNAPSRSLPMPTCCGVAGDLADVVDVVDQPIERHARVLRGAPPPLPARHDHPGVERNANHGAPLDQRADLIVGELPVVRHERAAVGVARPHRSAERLAALPRSWCRRDASHRGSHRAAPSPAAARGRGRRVRRLRPCRARTFPDRNAPVRSRAGRPPPPVRGAASRRWNQRPRGSGRTRPGDAPRCRASTNGGAARDRQRRAPAPARRVSPFRDTTRAALASSPTPVPASASRAGGCPGARAVRSVSRRTDRHARAASPRTRPSRVRRSGRSVMSRSRPRISWIGLERSRFHSSAFMARSRWASKMSMGVRLPDWRSARGTARPRRRRSRARSTWRAFARRSG